MPMDGKMATREARKYFEETHGALTVWEFRVEKVEYDEKDASWLVGCSFSPYMSGPTRLRYEVRISDEGKVVSTKKLE